MAALLIWSPMTAQKTKFLVGSTNGDITESVAVCELDESNGTIRMMNALEAGGRPGYVTVHGDKLYAVSSDKQSEDESTLRAFQLSEDASSLELLSEVSSKGLNPCHIAVAGQGVSLLAANYSSGSIVQYTLKPDGSIGDNWYFQQFQGQSVNANRQTGPHAHYINSTRDNKFVLTADLGTDKVMVHQVGDKGKIQPYQEQPFINLPPGSGPRHIDFHANNRWIYVLNELNSTITTVEYQQGKFKVLATISTLPEGFEGVSYSAAVRIHPNGKYVYSSNRGADDLSVFEIEKNGTLQLVQNFGNGVGWVRDFNLSPSGNFIVAGNERQGQIVLLRLGKDGKIQQQLSTLEFPGPSCFVFLN